jgi:hypothetical protein
MQNPRLKAMVVPREHGAWGMLLVPLATGAVVAARSAINPLALTLFVIATLALFWLRTPVEAWIGISAIKVHSLQERTAVLRAGAVLVIVAVVTIAALFRLGYLRGLLIVGSVAVLSFALQAVVKRMGRPGRMPAQLIGAVGLTSTAASAYYVASGHLNVTAVSLWIANWIFAGNQVHFVQLRIHSGRASSSREKIQQGYLFLIGQVVLLIVIGVLVWLEMFPKLMILAFIPAILRGTYWFLRGPQPLDVHKLGFSELFQSILFGALLCAAFLA